MNEEIKTNEQTEEKTFLPTAISPEELEVIFSTIDEPIPVNTVRFSTTDSTTTLFNAVNGSSQKISSVLGKVLSVTNIVIASANVSKEFTEKDNPDSEKVNKPCVHFFTEDGKHYASVSNGIMRSVKNLLSCGIIPTAEKPMKIIFSEIQTKNGKAHTLDLVD